MPIVPLSCSIEIQLFELFSEEKTFSKIYPVKNKQIKKINFLAYFLQPKLLDYVL